MRSFVSDMVVYLADRPRDPNVGHVATNIGNRQRCSYRRPCRDARTCLRPVSSVEKTRSQIKVGWTYALWPLLVFPLKRGPSAEHPNTIGLFQSPVPLPRAGQLCYFRRPLQFLKRTPSSEVTSFVTRAFLCIREDVGGLKQTTSRGKQPAVVDIAESFKKTSTEAWSMFIS